MFSYDAYKIAKRNNKGYKNATAFIRMMSRVGFIQCLFPNLTTESINMLQSDGYSVKRSGSGYIVSWKQKIGY